MVIYYVCSLGSHCHTATFLKRNRLKYASYPFDWIFSSYDNVINCIENNFVIFLDKSYYVDISDNQCGHSFYNMAMFNHYNPLKNEEDYKYYVRRVEKFNKLLKYDKEKLFIITFINMNNIDEYIKNNIIEFNNKFKKYTNNYTLLCIFNLTNKDNNYHVFTYFDNIHFLELHTISNSDGNNYINNNDTIYFDNTIKNKYEFNIEKIENK